jgi:hypothetical protein
MESLPLMLQAALLLLGCALSRYLWEINITVASVVLSVTSFGAIFYLFIIVAGTASDSCPYQTPAARIFRYIFHHSRHRILPILHSASAAIPGVVSSNFSRLSQVSWCFQLVPGWWVFMTNPWYSVNDIHHQHPLVPYLPACCSSPRYLSAWQHITEITDCLLQESIPPDSGWAQDCTPLVYRHFLPSNARSGPTINRLGSAVHLVDPPDFLGQCDSSVDLQTSHLNARACPISSHSRC